GKPQKPPVFKPTTPPVYKPGKSPIYKHGKTPVFKPGKQVTIPGKNNPGWLRPAKRGRVFDPIRVKDLGEKMKTIGLVQKPELRNNPAMKDLVKRIKDGKSAEKPLAKFDGKMADMLKIGLKNANVENKQLAMKFAQKNFGIGQPCLWWVDLCSAFHWHNNHCHWDCCYYPTYWDCWEPCHWHVVYCPQTACSWYFGVEGILVPDTGSFGIQEVKSNSPADRAGLQAGMMIVSVNGQALSNDAVMAEAIQRSGGRLQLEILAEGSDQVQAVDVQLEQVRRASY
ncbi:MAG: PDZ domain-containing protein, partial [Planctomycetales bacterium]